jgi:hypothetical protein
VVGFGAGGTTTGAGAPEDGGVGSGIVVTANTEAVDVPTEFVAVTETL